MEAIDAAEKLTSTQLFRQFQVQGFNPSVSLLGVHGPWLRMWGGPVPGYSVILSKSSPHFSGLRTSVRGLGLTKNVPFSTKF